jgi:hypothetical protein
MERRLFCVWLFMRRSAGVMSDEYTIHKSTQTFILCMDSVMGMHGQQLRSVGVSFPTIATQAEWYSAVARDRIIYHKYQGVWHTM